MSNGNPGFPFPASYKELGEKLLTVFVKDNSKSANVGESNVIMLFPHQNHNLKNS